MKIRILLLFSLSLLIFSCERPAETYENYVVLVSFDGCRWDYPEIYELLNFAEMAKNGVKAERVISSFPTKTFPNHYSIATGLFPDHHGLVNNSFYAPDLDLFYRMGDRKMVENPDFYGGEPIWNTAEMQNVFSASFFWVGSEAPIGGIQPRYWKRYDGDVNFDDRVDTVFDWLSLPLKKRPRLVLLYFEEPDGVGHDFGPVHEETGKVMEEMDHILGELRTRIAQLPYGDKVNLIVTSDHGMGATSSERYVNIKNYIRDSWIEEIVGGNPVYLIDAKEGFEDSVSMNLDKVVGVTAWRKEKLPVRLHYGTNPRISDVVVVADSSWSIGTKDDPSGYNGGAHGYDNRNTDMHNIFYAEGPDFKSGYIQPPFNNVDIYSLLAHLLDLNPAENDGDFKHVSGMLNE